MKVKILEKTFIGAGGNLHAGTEHEIEDNIAERLIARGVAEKAKRLRLKRLIALSKKSPRQKMNNGCRNRHRARDIF